MAAVGDCRFSRASIAQSSKEPRAEPDQDDDVCDAGPGNAPDHEPRLLAADRVTVSSAFRDIPEPRRTMASEFCDCPTTRRVQKSGDSMTKVRPGGNEKSFARDLVS